MRGSVIDNVPYVEFDLVGFRSDAPSRFTGIVDTGFKGFLKLPYAKAFPVGLILMGTETVRLADHSQVSQFSCLGTIRMFEREAEISISVAPRSPILVGAQTLSKLGLSMRLDLEREVLTFSANMRD